MIELVNGSPHPSTPRSSDARTGHAHAVWHLDTDLVPLARGPRVKSGVSMPKKGGRPKIGRQGGIPREADDVECGILSSYSTIEILCKQLPAPPQGWFIDPLKDGFSI